MPDPAATAARRIGTLMDEAFDCPDGARRHALAVEALALARSAAVDDALAGRACLLLAETSYERLDYAASYEAALGAAEQLARAGDEARRAVAANLCLVLCIETGDMTRALEYARTELAAARHAGDPARVAQLLHNQAVVFDIMEERDAAAACLVESAQVHATRPDGAQEAFFARVNLAQLHLAHAERLHTAGDEAGAAEARQKARQALPAIDWRADFAALQTWITVSAGLGDVATAREAALPYLRLVRRAGRGLRYATYALLALAECHLHAGRPDKAAVRFEGAIERLRQAHNISHLAMVEERLATLHAQAGDHAQGLAWMRRAHADRSRLGDEQHRLRSRLAAVEHETEVRSAQRREESMHAQRMAVIGRMIAEIHHALAEPLEQVQGLIAPWVAGETPRSRRPVSARALGQLITSIDAATALARQLKMFSYRAAPQPMEVELTAAVREAWRGLGLWRRASARRLVLEGGAGAVVSADAQRLGVMLNILLIEVDANAPGDEVQVRVDRGDDRVCMHVATARWPSGDASIGFTLCDEIAREMGGRLEREETDGPPPRVRYSLCLPAPAPLQAFAAPNLPAVPRTPGAPEITPR